MSPDQALHLAKHVLAWRHWRADAAAVVEAPVPDGEDLRIVVLYGPLPSLDRPLADLRRERVEIDGSHIEIFLHDPDTLRHALEAERHASARPLVALLAYATVVGPRPTALRVLAERAREIGRTEGRPLPAPSKALLWRLAQDLATPADADERAAILGAFQGVLRGLVLLRHGAQDAVGKEQVRRLRAVAPAEAARIDAALRQAWMGDTRDLLGIAAAETSEIPPRHA